MKEKGIELKFAGTHGGTYPGWEAPNWIARDEKLVEEFINNIKTNAGGYDKGREAHAFNNKKMPKPQISQFHNTQELREFIDKRTRDRKDTCVRLNNISNKRWNFEPDSLERALKETHNEIEKLNKQATGIAALTNEQQNQNNTELGRINNEISALENAKTKYGSNDNSKNQPKEKQNKNNQKKEEKDGKKEEKKDKKTLEKERRAKQEKARLEMSNKAKEKNAREAWQENTTQNIEKLANLRERKNNLENNINTFKFRQTQLAELQAYEQELLNVQKIDSEIRNYNRFLPSNSNISQHLTLSEKENLTKLLLQEELNGNGKYNINDRLAAVNNNSELLNKLNREAVITADIGFKSIYAKKVTEAGKVEIRAEHNHLTDHQKNTKELINDIQMGKIDKNTVITIERKQYGENLGMKDVIKIASILEHNEKNPTKPLKLPEELENTPIFQDALLYKAAKEKDIKVISLEGKNLEYGKASEHNRPLEKENASQLRNENREQYMTDVINEIRSKGYNVIANVGASHAEKLEKNLNTIKAHDPKSNDISRFNNISRKLKQEALGIVKLIPKGTVNTNSVKQANTIGNSNLGMSSSKKNNQFGR